MGCSRDMSSSGKKKENARGLIYAVAVNPPDFIHLVHNGCDKGFELCKISTRRQLLENVGEVEVRIAEEHLHQHLLQDSGADCARLVSQLLWDPFPELLESRHHALEEQSKLGAGLEVLVGGVPEARQVQLRQLLVDDCSNVDEALCLELHRGPEGVLSLGGPR